MTVQKMPVQKMTKAQLTKLNIEEDPGWYIKDTNLDEPGYMWLGPYDTKAEAEEDRVGLTRFYRGRNK